ncbi:MAG: hypothetical protein GY869_21115, partial [Planctomycetes bacterium]|nr:hypothetical protein [Planctomycetota bacterium]
LRLAADDSELISDDEVIITVAMLGDFNLDSRVGLADLFMLRKYWLQSKPFLDIAPFPAGNGIIDLQDFAYFAKHWLEEVRVK